MHQIRHGKLTDLEILRDLERRAGAIFIEYDMAAVAEDDPPSIATLSAYCSNSRLWVASDKSDTPIGYIIIDLVDGCAHIEQVSVDPNHARQGIGSSLINVVDTWARANNLSALTLTTFTQIPWNAPYYSRIGFDVVPESKLSPGLQRIRDLEEQHGLNRWPRVCMRRNIGLNKGRTEN